MDVICTSKEGETIIFLPIFPKLTQRKGFLVFPRSTTVTFVYSVEVHLVLKEEKWPSRRCLPTFQHWQIHSLCLLYTQLAFKSIYFQLWTINSLVNVDRRNYIIFMVAPLLISELNIRSFPKKDISLILLKMYHKIHIIKMLNSIKHK